MILCRKIYINIINSVNALPEYKLCVQFAEGITKIYEAELVNDGLSEHENGKTVDGESVRARMAEKCGV